MLENLEDEQKRQDNNRWLSRHFQISWREQFFMRWLWCLLW